MSNFPGGPYALSPLKTVRTFRAEIATRLLYSIGVVNIISVNGIVLSS